MSISSKRKKEEYPGYFNRNKNKDDANPIK